MLEILIPILVFLAVLLFGSAVLVWRAGRRAPIEERLFATETAADPHRRDFSVAHTVAQLGNRVAKPRDLSDLRLRLIRAGYPEGNAPAIYLGAQVLLAIIAVMLATLVYLQLDASPLIRICLAGGIVCALALAPNLVVMVLERRRAAKVREALPDAIDLLEIAVTAGLGMDQAWNAVSDEVRGFSPILADEMALANLEMHLGAARTDAMRNLAHRTGSDELLSLVAVLVQSERFGTSVGQALRTFADTMRQERAFKAEERAEQMTVKLLFPMLLFIFPTIFVVVLGPAAIKIFDMFAMMKA